MKKIAIIDYHMSNVLNVQRACDFVSLNSFITSYKNELLSADGAILPGVGAFGDAISILRDLELDKAIKEFIIDKPFLGICLGMQLLMNKSYEFGEYEGLGIIDGEVVKFDIKEKVPQVGWNSIYSNNSWNDKLLKNINNNENMYFVHSFYVVPEDKNIITSYTKYGNIEFCSSFQKDNVFATQFHPERSGKEGLKILKNFKDKIYDN